MSRFPVDEIFWRRTEDSAVVYFGRHYSVEIVEAGTEDLLTLWSAEEGGDEVVQPLVTDDDGRALGKDGVRPWSDTADYDVLVNGERYPKRAPAGGGGGGAVDSVAGKTGDVTLEPGDIEGLEDRLPFANVKAFGAKGDDDDDTEAIKAAIASFGAAGNSFGDTGNAQEAGVLYFPPGVFVTSETLKIFPGLVILGAGASATQLKLADGADCDLLQTEGFDELSGTESEEGPFKFAIRDIWLDGGEGSTEGRGVAIYGRYYLIDSVQISGFPGAGLWSKWAPSGDQMEASVRNVKIMGCGSPTEPALDWRGPHDSNFQDVQVIRPNGIGIRTSEGSAAGASFVNCHVWGETENYKIGWQLDQNAYLINCQGEGALETQLWIKQGECIVIGGHYFGFGEVGEELDESTAIRIGEEGEHFPEGLRIATRASGSKVCVDFDQDSGKSEISVLCEPREGGVVSTGTPATSSHTTLISDSPATSMYQAPKVNRTIASATSIEIPPGVVFVRISGSADIEEIEANADGQILILKFESTAKAVDGGNLHLNGDFEGEDAVLMLVCDGADWFEIGREGGAAELGYTAEDVAKKVQSLSGESEDEYPSEKAVQLALATKQPLDSDLTAIAALATTAFGRELLTLANAAAGRTAFGLGTAATQASTAFDAAGAAAAAQAASQPLDSDLTAIAALATTAFGRELLTLANAAAGRAALSAASIAEVEAAIQKSLVDAKGDLLVGTADNTVARKAAGSNGKVLGAASGESDGLKWLDNNRIIEYPIVIVPTVTTLAGFFIRAAAGETLKLIGVRHKLASGTCKWKIKRTTSAGSSSEPLKEKESKSEAQETTSEQELADKDLIEFICESVSSPGLGYFTVLIEKTRS
jgi:hypothetical protein